MKKTIHSAFYIWSKNRRMKRYQVLDNNSNENNDTKVNKQTNEQKKKLESLEERWHNGCDEMWSFIAHICIFMVFLCSFVVVANFDFIFEICWNRFDVNEISIRLLWKMNKIWNFQLLSTQVHFFFESFQKKKEMIFNTSQTNTCSSKTKWTNVFEKKKTETKFSDRCHVGAK